MTKNTLTVASFETQIIKPNWSSIKGVLPPTVKPETFKSTVITAVRRDEKLLRCTEKSLLDACIKCAQDGLLPDGREAAIVPFFDNKLKISNAQYMPMVNGIMKRAHELGDVISVSSRVVYTNDKFHLEYSEDGDICKHRPVTSGDRGDRMGAYAIFRGSNGSTLHVEYMNAAEIEEVRAVSRAKEGAVWKNWTDEMWRKTVIRRGSKFVPLSSPLQTIIEREDELVDFTQIEPKSVADPFDDEAIIEAHKMKDVTPKTEQAKKTDPNYEAKLDYLKAAFDKAESVNGVEDLCNQFREEIDQWPKKWINEANKLRRQRMSELEKKPA